MVNHHQKASVIERRNSVFVGSDVGTDPSQLKSEMMIQQRKFDRLEYKEKRLQVRTKTSRVNTITLNDQFTLA